MSTDNNAGWVGIIPALLKAQQQVEAVEKASKNDFGGYKYASAEDMITASRIVLHENGLIVTKNGWRVIRAEDGESAPLVEAVYVLAHENGSAVMCTTQYPICTGKGRPEDKALNASLTTGLSYFLRDLLLIPRCDVEVDQRPDTISRGSGVRNTPKPSSGTRKSASNQKTNFMNLVGAWINRDPSEKDTAEACLKILNLHTLPTDGTCSPKQFKEMVKWTEEQIENNIEPDTILRSND